MPSRPVARDSVAVEAGLDLNLTPDATFGLSYAGQLSGSAQDHGFKANFKGSDVQQKLKPTILGLTLATALAWAAGVASSLVETYGDWRVACQADQAAIRCAISQQQGLVHYSDTDSR